ncbi:MAG TPA: tetratricopeptide repeat protein [Candidatus Methylomirabilis sp.]|nr:tetratricopeptide repeat protein [Candidatus Methylomirabilis sp.]
MGATPGRWAPPLVVALTTLVSFAPALDNQFVVEWDDGATLVSNPAFRGLDGSHLAWMFTATHMGHWMPLTWISLGSDYLVWGMNPHGYHLTSVLLHVASSLVFYFVALRLLRVATPSRGETGLRMGAGAAALFFAIHPLRVESVAWVTERRDVLSGLWFLLTILTYLKAVQPGASRRWLGVSVGCYVLALASKASTMTLPPLLVILDFYPLRRIGSRWRQWLVPEARRIWMEKIPYLALALGAAVVAGYAQRGFAEPLAIRPAAGRIAVALYGLWFYVYKTAAPYPIWPLYEIPARVDPLALPMVASGAAVALLTGALFFLRRRWPAGLAVWIAYAIMLAPMSGLTQSGPQLVAARYTYLSCLGFALLFGAGVARVVDGAASRASRPGFARAGPAMLGLALLALAALSWAQIRVWRDSQSFWSHAVSADPPSAIAYNNLGARLIEQGRLDEAEVLIRKALQLRPEYEDAHSNLAVILERRGQPDQAREARMKLGYALLRRGKLREAGAVFQREVDARPEDAVAHNNLGVALFLEGDLLPAARQFQRALEIKPDFAEAKRNLAAALAQLR